MPQNTEQHSSSLLALKVLCPKNRVFTTISFPFRSTQKTVLWSEVRAHLQSSMRKLLDDNFSDNSSTNDMPAHVVLLFRFVW